MSSLTEQVKNNIKSFLPSFQGWLRSDESKPFIEERNKKENEFKNLLNKDNIDKLTEFDFKKIIASLWAYTGFTNKNYVADRILESTNFNTLKSELKNLLYEDKPLSIRYDHFFEKIKGIGPAGITEILTFVKKDQYGIWNDKSRRALEKLGFKKEEVPIYKYKITGSEYEIVNNILKSISKIIEPEKEYNLLLVDLFLYYILEYTPEKEVIMEDEDYSFDHDEIVDMLIEIGSGLGFEVESEKLIAKGAKVDVVWKAKIANLGVLNYVFEVQHAGSIDSLILNLQRAKNNPTVQKLIIVANKKNINKIKGEIESLSEDFRKSLTFLEAKDVEKIVDLWRELSSILSKLELVKSF